ncbi:MAG: DUF3035 domain-containing protein [Pseudomonadota bacterium]
MTPPSAWGNTPGMAVFRLPLRRVCAIAVLLAPALLAACANRPLMNLTRGQQGPDEFAIIPGKPIVIPDDLTALPPPSIPGTGSRTDPTPNADAVAALGGNPGRLELDGQTPDGTLLATTGRYGTDPEIRGQLGIADLQFRDRNQGRVLERLFGVTTYFDAYERESLDQTDETLRYRRAGAATPGAPPPPVDD